MVNEDAIERIIACAREGDVENSAEWLARHEKQAGDGDIDMDEVDMPGGEAVCVAYEPEVDVDVHYPEDQRWGEEMRENLLDRLYKGSFAGVSFPVRTGCEHIWKPETDLPRYDSELPDGGNTYYMASTTICVRPEDWLRIQFSMGNRKPNPTQADFKTWLRDTSGDTIEGIQEAIRAGDQSVPRPFIELDRMGRVREYQEGRHRGLAAYFEEVPYMDVFVFANYDTNKGTDEWEYEPVPEFPAGEV